MPGARRKTSAGRLRCYPTETPTFTTAVGMEIDRRASGMGLRSKRYAMVVDDGVIRKLNLEPDGSYGRIQRRDNS